MKNKDGVIIKPGQVWKSNAASNNRKAVRIIGSNADYYKGCVVFQEDVTGKLDSATGGYFKELVVSHDGADLAAAQADGWEVWVEGMEKPDSEVSTWGIWDENEWLKDTSFHPPMFSGQFAYRYKLKEEAPALALFPIDWLADVWPITHYKEKEEVIEVGVKIGGYRIFGFTDDEHDTFEGSYHSQPCSNKGNRRFAIGRLEQ